MNCIKFDYLTKHLWMCCSHLPPLRSLTPRWFSPPLRNIKTQAVLPVLSIRVSCIVSRWACERVLPTCMTFAWPWNLFVVLVRCFNQHRNECLSLLLLWGLPDTQTPGVALSCILGTNGVDNLGNSKISSPLKTPPGCWIHRINIPAITNPGQQNHSAHYVTLPWFSCCSVVENELWSTGTREAHQNIQKLFLKDTVKDKLACRGRSGNASSH